MLSTTLLIFAACAGVSKVEEMQGAPSNVNPYSDPKYYHLAEYALSERPLKVNSRYVTVLELTSASKQLVAGFIYRVNFTTAVTSCRRRYKMHKCTPISDKAEHICRVAFWEKEWEDFLEMQEFDCQRVHDNDYYD
ncbi:hypothetical protein V5799_019145 [Amblyomma americanum]|uniref:Cystatin domain-containing protein n=1 Tax=Amblyomma americanum TaxID=6943 RepID=A0AAQ4EX73_AMBAM